MTDETEETLELDIDAIAEKLDALEEAVTKIASGIGDETEAIELLDDIRESLGIDTEDEEDTEDEG